MLCRTSIAIAVWTGLAACPAEPAAIPTTESHFGHKIGADRTVLDWDRVVEYFRKLQKSSGRLLVKELGKSTEGRPFILVTISAPANLRKLDRYQWIQGKLADPRHTPPEEAERLIAEGKVVVLITCSIHATEIASSHTAVEFAHRLLTSGDPRVKTILGNTIFLLVPSLNPDGLDLVTRWYRKTLGTPFEGTSPPELYQKYAGHDNNRDWYIFSQQETRLTVAEVHNVWHPEIVYDVHQQGEYASRIFVPPWLDPIEPNIDPIIAQECNMIGAGMAADLTAACKTGVVINGLYDFWTPARHYQAYHGGLRILSESASAAIASPVTVRPEQIDRAALGYDPRERSWNYLEPWLGGEWRLRDIIDYQLIAWESVLYQAATRREDLLRNFYRIGRRAVERTTPYAFVVPAEQRDPGAARKLLETLAFGQVEIGRAAQPFEANSNPYAAGSYVIRLAQPYGSFAKTLLERQQYPDLRLYPGGPPKRPYDVTAHTLPLLMGVRVDMLPAAFEARLEKASRFSFPSQGAPALSGADSDSWREVNRIWQSGGDVWRDVETGDFYSAPPAGKNVKKLRRPRIGLYKSFVPNIDEGWTRWTLEQFGFKYTSVGNQDIRAGQLRRRYDVLVFPDDSPATMAEGFRSGSMPPEYCGGLGKEGAEALRRFAGEGGTLVFLNHASEYAIEWLGVQAVNVLKGAPSREFYSPGSLLNVVLETKHPLSLGLPDRITIWSQGSPAWKHGGGVPVARYPNAEILASGWLLGEKYLAGQAALLEAPLGTGRAILFGMRPQYRAQSYQTYKLFFNALVYF